ncbi:MAG TPA: DUF992 domain-containing protein [Rhizomicrobium sp.]|nr:DUF992 domain-containing protein [Rhizomicrobium sp.]
MSKKFAVLSAAVLAAGALALGTPADAAGVKVGTLTCHVASGWGFIFGSSKDLRCIFHPSKGPSEHYEGSVSKFGVDIGYTDSSVILWGVIAPTSSMKPSALEGDYVGATASATVGVGAGANVLVGGFDRSITLQPISISGSTGLNVAGGIGAIHLKYVPPM